MDNNEKTSEVYCCFCNHCSTLPGLFRSKHADDEKNFLCFRNAQYKRNLVTGKMDLASDVPTCRSQRDSIYPTDCGEPGRFFQPIEQKGPFV